MLQDDKDHRAEDPSITTNVAGIQAKDERSEKELKSLTLEALNPNNPAAILTRAYKDCSAEDAVGNGGSFLQALLLQGCLQVCEYRSSDYRAEDCAVLLVAQTLKEGEKFLTSVVLSVESTVTKR